MKKIHFNAAGIDIGARQIFVSVEGQRVKVFDTFTSSFRDALDYLGSHNIQTVAMEATGVYWVILHEILEQGGLDVWLVDGRETKQVPGRKTDVKDCQWIQQLHSYGLLNKCFVATSTLKTLRSYVRLREDHLRSAAMHINHMQKALTEMNIRLKEVLSQIHGSSGMNMIIAILSGERRKEALLKLCHSSIRKNKSEEVLKALEGHYTESGLFALQQAYDGYIFYQKKISECDKKIEETLVEIDQDRSAPADLNNKRKVIRHNKPSVKDLGLQMVRSFNGKDATALLLPGITDYTWMQLMSEVGTDLTRWPSEKHFTSWLGLAPGQNNSGKKRRSRSKGKPKAGQIFRTIARSLLESKNIGLGVFGRKMRSRKGPGKAIKATARKLAAMYWRLMVKGTQYVDTGIKYYEEQIKRQKMKYLQKLIAELDPQDAENVIATQLRHW